MPEVIHENSCLRIKFKLYWQTGCCLRIWSREDFDSIQNWFSIMVPENKARRSVPVRPALEMLVSQVKDHVAHYGPLIIWMIITRRAFSKLCQHGGTSTNLLSSSVHSVENQRT